VILNARVIGGLQGIDKGLADDKIIAVLQNDNLWGGLEDISELPAILVERLRHYFITYKLESGTQSQMTIEKIYNREHALQVVEAAIEDYNEEYGA
jgi:inorganic pyrophosphatase